MIKKNNVEKERNRYKTKTTGASLHFGVQSVCMQTKILIRLRMRRLICVFVWEIYQKVHFLTLRTNEVVPRLIQNASEKHSGLSLSRIPRDSINYFKISVLRHIRFADSRRKLIEQPHLTNVYVTGLLKVEIC